MSATTPETSTRLLATDAAVLVFLGALAAWPLADAYGGWFWLVTVVIGLSVGVGTALASRLLRLGAWMTVLILAAAYLLLGTAVAVPSYATARVLPNPTSLRALSTGIIDAWRDSLTMVAPLGTGGTVLIVPWVLALLAGLIAGILLWRTRFAGLAAMTVVILFVAAAAFGASTGAWTLTRGLILVTALIVWSRWRAQRYVRARWGRRVAWTSAVVLVAGGAGLGMASVATSDGPREVLRDYVTPPFDPQDYPSPLSRFRAYIKDLENAELFQVDGAAPGTRLTLATMDYFDGVVWNVSDSDQIPEAAGTFGRVRGIYDNEDHTLVRVTIGDYSGVWVPTAGQPVGVHVTDSSGGRDPEAISNTLVNPATGTVAHVGGVRTGQTFEFAVIERPAHTAEEILRAASGDAEVPMPLGAHVPADLVSVTQGWITESEAETGGEMASTLAEKFALQFYSDGTAQEVSSAAGHGTSRLEELVSYADMVGNDEQYASAMAVAALHYGLPTRVAMGFDVPEGNGPVLGSDIVAWTEVHLEGLGWVAFEPTPPEDRVLQQINENPDPEPQPQILPPPMVPDEATNAEQQIPEGSATDPGSDIWRFLLFLWSVIVFVAKVLLILLPLWVLLLIKLMRRRRRRRAATPAIRMSGGWAEITDRARDLGTRLPRSNTRFENSVVLATKYPNSATAGLATTADQHTYGPTTPTDDEARAYWADVSTALTRMRKAAPWWRRPLVWFSPASIPWSAMWAATRSRIAVIGQALWGSKIVRFVTIRSSATRAKMRSRKKKSSQSV